MKRILCLLFGHDVLINSKKIYDIRCGRCGKRADVSRVPDNRELRRFKFNNWGFVSNEKRRWCVAFNYSCILFYISICYRKNAYSFVIYKYDPSKSWKSMFRFSDLNKEYGYQKSVYR